MICSDFKDYKFECANFSASTPCEFHGAPDSSNSWLADAGIWLIV